MDIRVASRVAERLKTEDLKKLGNNQESASTSKNDSLVPSLPAKIKTLLILANKLPKLPIKIFP